MTAPGPVTLQPGLAMGLRDVHLTHRTPYGMVTALRAVTLGAPAGQVTLLAGPNGAGKSSALSTLAGLQRAARGSVQVGAEWVDVGRAASAVRGVVGWLGSDPDDQLIAPRVQDDIAFGLLNRGEPVPQVMTKVRAIAEALGVAALLPRSIAGLSHGERQRVALAGLLVLEPQVLLLDEPTLGLDRPGRRALLEILSRCRRAGMTLVVASHDESLAEGWADHVVLLHRGRVVLAGARDDVVSDPAWRETMDGPGDR